MKLEDRLLRMTTVRLLMMAILLPGFASLSGCITNKVLDLRREREGRTKEATNFWSLFAVHSAHVVAGGEAFACVEFRDSPAAAPQAYTINLSQTSRIGRTYADLMPAGRSRTESARENEAQAGLTWRLYPLQEAHKGCGNATDGSPSPVFALRIETVQIHREEQSRLPGMLLSPDGDTAKEGRIVEVSFAPDDREAKSSGAKDVLLVYLPPAGSGEQAQAIGVAGAFEPGSEWVNPYTLLVVPAVVADTTVSYMIIMLGGRVWEYWGYR